MIRDIIVPAKICTCEKCDCSWTVYDNEELPKWCRNQACRSREWNGKKQEVQSHVHEIKLPAPRIGGRPKTMPRSVAAFDDTED